MMPMLQLGSVRRWLRLPKDTTNAFLHASVRFGGLGVLQLRRLNPEVRIQRMTNVLQQAKQDKDSFLMDVLQQNTTIMSQEIRETPVEKRRGAESSGLRRLATMEQLYNSVDGYGLKLFVNAVPSVTSGWWMVLTGCQPISFCNVQKFAPLSYTIGCDRQGKIHWQTQLVIPDGM